MTCTWEIISNLTLWYPAEAIIKLMPQGAHKVAKIEACHKLKSVTKSCFRVLAHPVAKMCRRGSQGAPLTRVQRGPVFGTFKKWAELIVQNQIMNQFDNVVN